VAIFIFVSAHPLDNPLPKLVRFSMSPGMAVNAKPDQILRVKCCGQSVAFIHVMGRCRKVTAPWGSAEDIPSADNSLHQGITLPFDAIHLEPQKSFPKAKDIDHGIEVTGDESQPSRLIDTPDELLLFRGYAPGFCLHFNSDHPTVLAADQVRDPLGAHWASPGVIVEYPNSIE
jgi:hypothetical protein